MAQLSVRHADRGKRAFEDTKVRKRTRKILRQGSADAESLRVWWRTWVGKLDFEAVEGEAV
jgi:hypothetical protein